jgi:prophage maintenance system killer protein
MNGGLPNADWTRLERASTCWPARGEASALFGNPRGETLDGILGSIEQTMFGEPLYRSREEKAAHLIYFIVKDHPFTDGNKRIGSFLFMLYLEQEQMAQRLNPEGLTALTLLIAESAPSNKDLMIRLILNLLA